MTPVLWDGCCSCQSLNKANGDKALTQSTNSDHRKSLLGVCFLPRFIIHGTGAL